MAAASKKIAVCKGPTSNVTINPSSLDSSVIDTRMIQSLTTSSSTINPAVLEPSIVGDLSTDSSRIDLSTIDLSTIDGSIINCKIAQSSTSKEMGKGSRVKWQTSDYDDEALLLNLRLAYPGVLWAETANLFNGCVPLKRSRTLDAVTNKGQQLMRAYYESQAVKGRPQIYVENEVEWGQAAAQPTSQSYSDLEGQETLPPYSLWDFPARHMEVMSNSWDGFIDTEGYSKAIVEEMEALEELDALKKRAMEAASGIQER